MSRLVDDGVLDGVTSKGDALQKRLDRAFGQHPHVGDIRGRGMFRGVELVKDRTRKTPFAPDQNVHARLKAEAFAQGLICYPMGGTMDGKRGDHVLLAPPFTLTEDHLDELVDKLAKALDRALPA